MLEKENCAKIDRVLQYCLLTWQQRGVIQGVYRIYTRWLYFDHRRVAYVCGDVIESKWGGERPGVLEVSLQRQRGRHLTTCGRWEESVKKKHLNLWKRENLEFERTCYWKLGIIRTRGNTWTYENCGILRTCWAWGHKRSDREALLWPVVTGFNLRNLWNQRIVVKLWEWRGIMPIFMKIWERYEKTIVIVKLMKK